MLFFAAKKETYFGILRIPGPGMQNQYGGYENDCSVARLAENRLVPIPVYIVKLPIVYRV